MNYSIGIEKVKGKKSKVFQGLSLEPTQPPKLKHTKVVQNTCLLKRMGV